MKHKMKLSYQKISLAIKHMNEIYNEVMARACAGNTCYSV